MKKVARSSGNEELMRRLIELRAEALPTSAEKITQLELMYEANELLGDAGSLRGRLATDG